MTRLAAILLVVPLLISCAEALKSHLLMDPIKDAIQLLTVIPSQELSYASAGTLSDGRSLNPVLSKSLRTFEMAQFAKRRHGFAMAAVRQALGGGRSASSMR